jgi:hypothetical protein
MRTALHVKFPDNQGKNRELQAFLRFCRLSSSESPRLYWPSLANSLLDGTGNFDRVSGNSNSLIDFRSAKALASQTGLIPIAEAHWS